ncbi:myb family transcription factor EFM [Punica granatum]|uniref:HTH myb-type domain-containing protein n=2 Tax=Punica granatum TaxID=22663 RepID=A0A218W107_PUNGR|nr:myb family transcription factor EFM [Punica granatum]OWM65990.1 hypothetical protein CDL15_Pgr015415 [Punica granatum]PKI66705.1 hypothetical protein CRG98_012900 [Punica granatum]
MASPSELSLECKPHSYSMLLKSFGDQQAAMPSVDPAQKLEDFLARLEEERLKIDAFKRELPLCMQLLTNALEASRQQLQAYRANQGPRPVLEEFIPLKKSPSEGTEKTSSNLSDKANWMTSAQLWSQASDGTKQQTGTITSPPKEIDIGFNVSPKLALDNKPRNGGAFLPFSKDRNMSTNPTFQALPELALASNEKEMEDKKYTDTENGILCPRRDNNNNNTNSIKGGNIINGMVIEQAKATGSSPEGQPVVSNTAANTTSSTNPQTHRKARRCWSPDLHRRFVNALQMLGGSQVATPKQIRELMKVDGLTNDEVKSHLQKYRLHTRRPSPSPQATGAATPQLVVLGGIWVPPEYATAAAAAAHGGSPALYGAHPASHAPPHYCTPTVPAQEYYTSAGPPPSTPHHEIHHHPLHHQIHVYKATSQTHSSPESGMRGTGDQSESIEDGKSESSSWKGDTSGENGGDQRKGLSNLRDDNEESNGSEITLKF